MKITFALFEQDAKMPLEIERTNIMDMFKFWDESSLQSNGDVFLARINPEIEVTDQLICSLCYLLWFPGYFGFNWDALYECLRDFEWMRWRKIIIIHEVLPQLPRKDLEIYLEILHDSVGTWRSDPRYMNEHELEVVFPSDSYDTINEIITCAARQKRIRFINVEQTMDGKN
jgi:hypothetical protein